MIKLYLHTLKRKGFICFLLSYLCILGFYHFDIPYDSFVIYGHFITLIPNTAFIMFAYDRVHSIMQIYQFARIRITKAKLQQQLLCIAIINTTLYIGMIFFLPLPLVTIYDALAYGKFICITVVMLLGLEYLYSKQIKEGKDTIVVILPILINLVFHFGYILIYWT